MLTTDESGKINMATVPLRYVWILESSASSQHAVGVAVVTDVIQ